MANYDKYDPRLESLVVETATFWAPEIENRTDVDRVELASLLHKNPAAASTIHYERVPTGFIRQITATPADVERLLQAGSVPHTSD